MEARVLGEVEIRHGGSRVDLGGPKPRVLVGLLLAAQGRAVPVEHLIDQVWGDRPPARVEVSLQSYVARLRRALATAEGGRGSGRLRTHPAAYSLVVDTTDAQRFAEAVRPGPSQAGDAARLTALTDALGLWRGRPYAGAECPALDAEATRLQELRTTAVQELLEIRLRRGEHSGAIPELESLARTQPLHEPWWALLARAYYAAHRQADALAALRRARSHLAEELGVDPGPELRRVEEAVLRQDPALDAPSPATHAPEAEPAPAAPGPAPSGLVGREDALATVSGVLDGVAAGRGRAIVVAGEPGVGKTRLLEAAVELAAGRGVAVGRGGWEDEGAPPLWGWTRAATQLLGDARVLDSSGTDAGVAAYRQAESLVRSLAERGPALLVLDDVHWADADSLRLLRRVASELTSAPLALLVSLRDEAVGEPAVADVLGSLARAGAERLDLRGLGADQVHAWLGSTTGLPVSRGTAERLVERTGGNPFFLSELVRLLVAEGALGEAEADAWDTVPAGVRDVVRQRLSRLGAGTREVAGTAAVAGRTFDHVVVAEAARLTLEEVAEHLDALQGVGLLDDTGPGQSRFSHALVQQAVREGLAPAERARSHAAVAAALERRHQGGIAEHSASLAEHYRLAGPAHARSAWLFAATAAGYAADRSAHDEALRLWLSAADLQPLDPATTAEERERLLLGRARALGGLGRPLDAWEPVAAAATSALERGAPVAAAAAILTVTEDFVWGWRLPNHHDPAAVALWRRVREEAGEQISGVDRARLMAAEAFEDFYRADAAEETTRLAEAAVAAVREATTDAAQRLAVGTIASSALLRPRLVDRGLALLDELVELAMRAEQPAALSSSLTTRAALLGERGRLADARSDVVRATEVAHRHRLPQNLVVTGWARGVLLQVDEEWEQAEALLDELDAFEATLAVPGQLIGLGQRAVVRELLGRLPELRAPLGQAAGFHPFLREMHALALVRDGAADRARQLLGPWSEQPPIAADYLWALTSVARSWVWTGLGDRAAVADLREALTPYADRLVYGSGTVAFAGSLAHWVGELDATAGDDVSARKHLEQALAVHREQGLGFWVGLSERALARLPA